MSDARQIMRNTFVLGLSRILERATGIVLAFLIARMLGPSGLGIYSVAVAYYAVIAMAGEMGATNLLVRELARDRSLTSRYLSHVLVMTASASVIAMVGFAAVLTQLDYEETLAESLFVIVAAILPGTLKVVQEAVFVAHQRVEFATITTFAASVVNIALGVALLKGGHGIVSLVVLFAALQYAIALTYLLIINRWIARLRWEFSRRFAGQILRDMRAFAGSSLLGGLFSRVEIIILSAVATPSQVGFYSAAYKLVDLCYFIPQTFMTNVYPTLSRAYASSREHAQKIQEKAITCLLVVALPLSVGLAVGAGPLILLAFGPGFSGAVTPLRVLSASVVLFCLHAVLWRILAARGEQALVLRVQAVTIVARIGTGYPLISAFGAVGAAITTTVSLMLHTGLLSYCVRRDGTRMAVGRRAWRFATAAAGTGAVIWLALGHLQLWEVAPLALLAYAALVTVMRGFDAEDIALLRSLRVGRGARRSGSPASTETLG
jgi:O-antigen/teichoic acid export membrane protein